jgi:hypothetical protein
VPTALLLTTTAWHRQNSTWQGSRQPRGHDFFYSPSREWNHPNALACQYSGHGMRYGPADQNLRTERRQLTGLRLHFVAG